MKRIIYFTTIFTFFITGTFAQGLFSISYDIGVPLGQTTDYIGAPSFRGFGVEGRGFITDNLSYGGSFNWAVFYEEIGPQKWEGAIEETGTVYGTQYRYINSFPLMATMHYYFGDWNTTRLYLGGGLGAQKIDQRTDFGLYTVDDKNWRFGLAPEVGVLIPVNFNSSINLAARYQYALNAGDQDAVSYLTFKIGLAFM
jgi:opacity protein-like surface antigen